MAKQTTPLNSEALEQHEGVVQLMKLFSTDLKNVQFPGVNGESLEAELKTLTQARADLETAERTVEEARTVVHNNAARLQKHMTLALSYARIYAENEQGAEGAHNNLSNKLGGIALPGLPKTKMARKTKAKPGMKEEEKTNTVPNAEILNTQTNTENEPKPKSKSKNKGTKKSGAMNTPEVETTIVLEQELRETNSETAIL